MLIKILGKNNLSKEKIVIITPNFYPENFPINNFVDTAFLARDSKSFRDYYNKINPGIDTKIKYEFLEGIEEDLDIPINMNFFWPDA